MGKMYLTAQIITLFLRLNFSPCENIYSINCNIFSSFINHNQSVLFTMVSQYLSIKEVSEVTGKSASTVTRVSRRLLKEGSLIIRQEGKKIFIHQDFIHQLFTDSSINHQEDRLVSHVTSNSDEVLDAKNETIQFLKDELTKKDELIKDYSKKVDELIERQRENNILIRSFQDNKSLAENTDSEIISKEASKKKFLGIFKRK
jgi:DNA-binding transcriptional ArsR family regulator